MTTKNTSMIALCATGSTFPWKQDAYNLHNKYMCQETSLHCIHQSKAHAGVLKMKLVMMIISPPKVFFKQDIKKDITFWMLTASLTLCMYMYF